MLLDKDEFIFGLSIDSEYGKIRFLKYFEFTKHKIDAYLFNQNILHIYYMYKKEAFNDAEKLEFVESIKKNTLREMVCKLPQFAQAYINIFTLVLDMNEYTDKELEQIISEILLDEDRFNYYRSLIQDMNVLVEDEVSDDETTQMYIELTRQAKSEGGQPNSISNIVASLALAGGYKFEDIAYMSVIQVNFLFQKLGQFKNYETTTLFATVSSDVKIESWAEVPDLFKKESLTIEGKEFNKKYGGLTK